MKKVYLLLIAFAIFSDCLGQSPGSGDCPKVQVEQNFNLSEYLGTWYEQQKYPVRFEIGGKCINAEYTLKDDGTVKVINSMKNDKDTRESIEGSAVVTSTTGEAKLAVTFKVPFPVTSNYWVLGTDYTSYSVVWSCRPVADNNAQTAWILTREQHPPKETIKIAREIFVKNKISLEPLTETDQSNC